MRRIKFIVFLFFAVATYGYSQSFRITPNNNQYYYVDYYLKSDSNSLGKIILLFNVTNPYKSTFVNPVFSWNNGAGKLETTMTMPGQYQIELNLEYNRFNNNCIAVSEFGSPHIIDVAISDLNRHLIKIEYLSDLSGKSIVKRISKFNPLEAQYNDLISFIYDYNFILRKYDPYCELIFPEIITDDFSKKITESINSSWKKTRISSFYSLCKDLNKVLQSDSIPADPELIASLAQAPRIKLNYYNAHRISYLIDLLENSLKLPSKHSLASDIEILESFNALKEENIDSTDRFLIVANVVKNGFQKNDLSVAYSPAPFKNLEYKKRQRGYFNCPSSPSYCIFPSSDYLLWVENKNKEKLSGDKLINPKESRFKEIVLPVESSLAIVRLHNNFGKNLKFDFNEFQKDLNKLIIEYNCLFLSNISLSLN